MRLKVVLPFCVYLDQEGVQRIIVDTAEGSFGIWSNRLDCAATLVPGILTFATASQGESHVAIDEGSLVKVGDQVWVSVRRAIGGLSLDALHQAVEEEYRQVNEQERDLRLTMLKLESGFVRGLAGLKND